MTGETESLILEYWRRFERKLFDFDAKIDAMRDDVYTLKVRMTGVEENLAGVQRRIDRVEVRLDRIERRLELTEA